MSNVRLHRMFAVFPDRKQESLRDFAKLMHNYFVSAPFYRGSASIGRSLFAGLYLKLFGEKLTLVADIDVMAILTDEATFVSQFFAHHFERSQPDGRPF